MVTNYAEVPLPPRDSRRDFGLGGRVVRSATAGWTRLVRREGRDASSTYVRKPFRTATQPCSVSRAGPGHHRPRANIAVRPSLPSDRTANSAVELEASAHNRRPIDKSTSGQGQLRGAYREIWPLGQCIQDRHESDRISGDPEYPQLALALQSPSASTPYDRHMPPDGDALGNFPWAPVI